MVCNTKTMLKVGLGLFASAAIAYITLPEFRSWILAASPTLLFLLCPISMLLCMKMMHGKNGQGCSKEFANNQAPATLPDKMHINEE